MVPGRGIRIQSVKLIVNSIVGATINITKLEPFVIKGSFKSNLTPSAKACNRPQRLDMLGPLLLWIDAKSFLSKTVKKAIVIIINIIDRT